MPNDPKDPRDSDPAKKAPDKETDKGDDEALIAERANERSSDRVDGRDGVDNSDMIGNDPDAAGKPRRGRGR